MFSANSCPEYLNNSKSFYGHYTCAKSTYGFIDGPHNRICACPRSGQNILNIGGTYILLAGVFIQGLNIYARLRPIFVKLWDRQSSFQSCLS